MGHLKTRIRVPALLPCLKCLKNSRAQKKFFHGSKHKMAGLVEPVRVSPFIKFFRWSFLLAGIMYGSTKYKIYSQKQKAIRDEFERTKPERDAKLQIERARNLEEEMKILAEITGAEVK